MTNWYPLALSVFLCSCLVASCAASGRTSGDADAGTDIALDGVADTASPDVSTRDTSRPPVDTSADTPDVLPDIQSDADEACEETNLVPPALQGDIQLSVADPSDIVSPGLGYDTRRGELLQLCVSGDIATSSGEDVTYEFRELETRADLSEALSVGVDVSLGFMGYGFDNRFRLARSRDVSSYNLNIWVRVRVITGSEALVSNVAIRESFAALLDEDPFEFLERCGDRFVQSVTFGGELIVILSVETYSESDRFDLENRLSARFGLFGSLSVDVESSVLDELDGRDVSVEVTRTGGGGALPPMDSAEALFEYARSFPAEVASHAPVAFRFVTRPYDRIHDASVCLPGFDEKSIALMDEAWDMLNEAVGIRNALEEAIANPQAYVCGNNEQRRAQLAIVATFLAQLDAAAEACALEMSVPSRTPGTGVACRALETLLDGFNPPEIPLRWQQILTFEASARERYHSFFLRDSLACRPLGVEGLWSKYPENNRCPNPDTCWMECPVGAMSGPTEYEITFADDRLDDNRGVCSYAFGCFNVEDAYLLEECEESGE